METLAAVFGRRVRALRQAKGMTQEQLGRAAKMDYKHIGAIERGAKTSSFSAIEKLAEALGVEYYQMFIRDERKTSAVDKEVRSMLRDAGRIDSSNVEEFLKGLRVALKKLEKRGT
jgi:transcriptional regulator with XRE-family HTH domain